LKQKKANRTGLAKLMKISLKGKKKKKKKEKEKEKKERKKEKRRQMLHHFVGKLWQGKERSK